MNMFHGWLCSSAKWAAVVRDTILPYVLADKDLGAETLEIGPGYGATTDVLVGRTRSLTAIEIDPVLARRLEKRLGSRVRVVEGDGTKMPFLDGSFDAVTSFSMLHHVPSPALQDRLFAEAFRVVRPGGLFIGSDSVTSLGLRLLHIGDTMVLVDPDTLPDRLRAVGFTDIAVSVVAGKGFSFSARRPAQ